jgi:adenylosuccinate lyase
MHAEVTTFGTKLANFWEELYEHLARLESAYERWNIVKISGPVGTHENVPEEIEDDIAEVMGKRPIPIATQIIPRVKVLAYLDLLNQIGATLEKFATDLRDMQRPEIYEVEEDFPEGAEGSSIMVHKHNPETCERVCSLARQLAGIVVTARMNVALWHERDLTNSANERHILPDAAHVIVYIVRQMTAVIDKLHVHPKRMLANINLTDGIVRSSLVLNALVENGVDRSVARSWIEPFVRHAWDRYREGEAVPALYTKLAGDPGISQHLSREALKGIFDPDYTRLLTGVQISFRRLGWEVTF